MKRLWVWLVWATILSAQVVPDVYIVELSGEPAASYAGAGKERAAALDRRAQIQAEQQSVRTALAAMNAEVLGSMDTVANALIVRVPEAEAANLSRIPGVKRVHPVYEVKLHLDRALPLIGAPDAWRQIGGQDQAGLGAKIGVIDTGIDPEHPAFQDPSLPVPEGFPKTGREGDRAFTNNKVIVARTYEDLLGRMEGATPRDEVGHGTAVAMIAAGAPNQGPLALITGVAPKAYLGSYKVFSGNQGTTRTDVVLKAIDDAVADGMNVLNLSIGSALAARPEDSISAQAVERAFAAGVLVVASAGNEGPDPNTISSYATALSAIGVGASSSDRTFGQSLRLDGGPVYIAYPGTGPNSNEPITAPLRDVANIDESGLACAALPEGSLDGRIALILRGECFFEDKLKNAQQAGARAAVIYTDAERPVAIMAVGEATLPAVMVSYEDGLDLKRRLESNPDLSATVDFKDAPIPSDPNRLASFSSRGPNADEGIKPDLLAIGTQIYTATQKWNPEGDLYDPTGYALENGTSFSTALVTGAAAVLKAARPGLKPEQYRSLLINTASVFPAAADQPAGVQRAGAGVLDLASAVQSTVAAYPASLSFGAGGGTVEAAREITVSNIGTASDTLNISVVPIGAGPAPVVSANTVEIAPGASQTLQLSLAASGLEPGEYQGFLRIQSTLNPVESRIPYWYAVRSGVPANLTILETKESGLTGSLQRRAIYFRVTESSGVAIRDLEPTVRPISGGGEVVQVASADALVPGAYFVDVRLGLEAGRNEFQIQAGEIQKTVVIEGRHASQP